jgi:hypothetical protein
MSAGSKTDPGGYVVIHNPEQFGNRRTIGFEIAKSFQ